MIFFELFRILFVFFAAYIIGKLVSMVKLPSILGWLIAGMLFGPHCFNFLTQSMMDATYFKVIIHILECAVGLMIGTELVFKKLKKSGKSIIITTLTQSLGTFLLVSLVFGIVFYIVDVPIYLALIFGGIALATAPAPALSIVREFKCKGPVTNTLIPMAALDDIVGCIVFFTIISIVSANNAGEGMSPFLIVLIIILPLVVGIIFGVITGFLFKLKMSRKKTLVVLILMILVTSSAGLIIDYLVLPSPALNYMLLGMAFSAAFSNMIKEEKLEELMHDFNPILGVAMILVILNLGAPLDYHLIFGAGLYTAIYIISRALGKYFGAFFGAAVTKAPKTVRNFLGFTLLPHSGVSLLFTGIAASTLSSFDLASAQLIQGTIAAAAIINEVIAVIMAKKGFEWAKELNKDEDIAST